MTFFDTFQPIVAIAPTPQAAKLLAPLSAQTSIQIWAPQPWDALADIQVYSGSLSEHLAKQWPQARTIIFCMAMGATVRLIAPLLTHKDQDPSVLVIDAQGKFVVSVCGGHRQGSDQLAQGLASLLQGQAVLTGASAGHQWPGVDTLGTPLGWQRQPGDWTTVSSLIAQATAQSPQIEVIQTGGSALWRAMLPDGHPLKQTSSQINQKPDATVWIGYQDPPQFTQPAIAWTPCLLWIGVGCERGTPAELIQRAIHAVLKQNQFSEAAVAGIASLDLKQDETGILKVCEQHDWPFFTFDAATLSQVDVPNPSDVVQQAVQTPSVSEAAAITAAQRYGSWDTETKPTLLAQKSVHRESEASGAVTIAIALAEREWIGSSGKLALIGCGPGHLDQMTPAAQAVLSQVDVVIGYQLYIDLVRSRLRPGQIIEPSPITQERARAQRAIELAQWGLNVAVISSGDCGIYGMAGLVMEELEAQAWDGQSPDVEIFPGISALQAAASRVGTPLMHDFCAISLSDLLTPWEVIETRLRASAAADFIVALYNPKSKNRQTQLSQAQSIFLEHRPAKTPVAIVRSAYRDDEFRQCSTLEQLHTLDVDMLTLVLIGNQSTRLYHNWMITPRGYLGFE